MQRGGQEGTKRESRALRVSFHTFPQPTASVELGCDLVEAFEMVMADPHGREMLAGWSPERWESVAPIRAGVEHESLRDF